MSWLAILILLAAGAFWLHQRGEVLSLHRTTLGGRFPMGCVIAEGVVILAIAVIAAALRMSGALD